MEKQEELDYIPGAGIITNMKYYQKRQADKGRLKGYKYTEDNYYILNEHNLKLSLKNFLEDNGRK